jgi:tryptophan-rich sensory protein
MSSAVAVRSRIVDITGLVLFVALCLGIGALGAALTEASVKTWYSGLAKPSFTPPDAVFGPVWTVLYILMGIAAWRVWRIADRDTARGPLTLFALQLAINLGWTVVFFGLQKIGAAVATAVVLDIAVLVTMLAFRTVDRVAALLMAPSLALVMFATVLNIAIWQLNPTG